MASTLLVFLFFVLSVGVTLHRGSSKALVWLYLPTLLLLLMVPQVRLPLIPDADQQRAVMYGILVGILIRGESLAFRLIALDWVVLSIAVLRTITAMNTEGPRLIFGGGGTEVLEWVMPYLLARNAFADPDARKDAVTVLAFCGVIVAAFALVELRLRPYIYSRTLEDLGIVRASNTFVYHRFGLFRPMVGFAHPIDLGNCGIIMAAMGAALAQTVRMKLTHPITLLATGSGLALAIFSMSFTSYMAVMILLGVWAMLTFQSWTRVLLVPLTIGAIVVGVVTTLVLMNWDTENRPEHGTFMASLWIRAVIVQNTWDVAAQAGLFGFGKTLTRRQLALDSIDNAYMLFVLRYGWLYLGVWLLMSVMLVRHAAAALRVAATPIARGPVNTMVAGVIATMAAMYTVWFGFAYALLFAVMIGMLVSMGQTLTAPAAVRPVRATPAAPHPLRAPVLTQPGLATRRASS